MREEKKGTRYFSFQELPNISRKRKRKVDEEKQDKFVGKCSVCGNTLHYIVGTNVIVCSNPDCKGFKNKGKEKKDNFVYRVLNYKNNRIAQSLFGD